MRNIDALVKRFENLTECEEAATYEYQGATRIQDRYRNPKAWEQLHRNYKVVRLVPECEIAMIKGRQRLTEEQREALESIGFEIERY